jgi:hypothetical protein
LPHPWNKTAKYDWADYELDPHFGPYRRDVVLPGGGKQTVEFRFDYHCFTEDNIKASDHRSRFIDSGAPAADNRVFCPQRWLLLFGVRQDLLGAIDAARLMDVGGYNWMWLRNVPGIKSPHAVFLKVAPRPLADVLIVNINSAYVRTNQPARGHGATTHLFPGLVALTLKTGKLQGSP